MKFLGMICFLVVVAVGNGLVLYGKRSQPAKADLGDPNFSTLINQINSLIRQLKSLQEVPDVQSADYQERLDEVNKRLASYMSEIAKHLEKDSDFIYWKARLTNLAERIERQQEDKLPETSPRYEELTKDIKEYSDLLERSQGALAGLLENLGIDVDITDILQG